MLILAELKAIKGVLIGMREDERKRQECADEQMKKAAAMLPIDFAGLFPKTEGGCKDGK